MLRFSLLLALSVTPALAQDPAGPATTPQGASVLVLGAVQRHAFRGPVLAGRLLAAAKPRPEADLTRTRILSARRETLVHLPAALRTETASEPWILGPDSILLVPAMPRAGESRIAPSLRVVETALRSKRRRTREHEILLRLFLLEHHPDTSVRRAQSRALETFDLTRIAGRLVALSHREPLARDLFRQRVCIQDCFPAGTAVHTVAGRRTIDAVRVGDRILDGQGRAHPVRRVLRSRARDLVTLRVGAANIHTTPGHRIRTPRGFRAARRLRPGDLICTSSGVRTIDGVTVRSSAVPVFNLEVEGRADFLVGDVQLVVASHAPHPPAVARSRRVF